VHTLGEEVVGSNLAVVEEHNLVVVEEHNLAVVEEHILVVEVHHLGRERMVLGRWEVLHLQVVADRMDPDLWVPSHHSLYLLIIRYKKERILLCLFFPLSLNRFLS